MQKKDNKVCKKTANKQERQRKQRERERKIEIDSQLRSKSWLLHMREKQKITFNYVRLVKKYAFFPVKINLSYSYAN